MNLAACSALPRTPENATWYRAVQLPYLATALRSSHTRGIRSRFNPGPLLPAAEQFEILYFAEDQLTATFELGALLGALRPGGFVAHPRISYAMLSVQITLQAAADLTDVTLAQMRLQTSAQELTGDWDHYQIRGPHTPVSAPVGVPPTQQLGKGLFATGVEGFRSLSAKIPCNRILMVFPDNLRSGSSLIFRDPSGSIVHHVP